MRRIAATVAVVIAAGILGGCGNTKEVLGIQEKRPPDEFAVYSRAPLSLPPEFGLRPPTPGTERPDTRDPSVDAKRAMLAGRALRPVESEDASPGLRALLRQAGAVGIDPAIRDEINRETTALIEAESSFTDSLLFWREAPEPGDAVDAPKEAQRIRQNQALGQPLGEGDTPTIEKKEKGWLEGIFD